MSDSSGLFGKLKGKRGNTTGAAADELTGLPDRTNLRPWAAEALQRAKSASSRCAVAFVSIGELRDVNDTHGPAAGDALLQAAAERLRTIDLPDTRIVRYQGSEFCIILEGLPSPEAAQKTADFLVELMREPFATSIGALTVPCHVGLSISSDVYDLVDDFIRDAHEALVDARTQGPNASQVHDESKRMLHSTRVDEARLQTAIEENEFVLFYQPIVRLDNGQLIGVEALIRWRMPGATNVGLLHPHDFMPLVERTGLAPRIGGWVVGEACRQTAVWQAAFPSNRNLFVTVNVGAHQLAAKGFAATVHEAIEQSGGTDKTAIEPWQLCLDITEDALRYNSNASWAALRELKQIGVKVGLDDFGTGVSSLLYLRELALDLVRLDRVFVSGVEHNPEDRAIIKHMRALAHDLGLVTIAEGVETAEQADALAKLGVDLAQGFHFGRPEPAAVIEDMLRPEGEEAEKRWKPSDVYDFEET